MLSAYYTDTNGQLRPGYPAWDSFAKTLLLKAIDKLEK